MEHQTTPYYEPKIYKTPAPAPKKKRFPLIHMIICLGVILMFAGLGIYNMVTQADVIATGKLPGVLLLVKEIIILLALGFSAFLLFKKSWHFVWPFLGTFLVSFLVEAFLIAINPPKDLLSQELWTHFGIAAAIFLAMFPVFGPLSDKLKLFAAHREIFDV
ncbi:MAG: hypothetical protein JXX14_10440 [Deltaproteobacteria bacterium]|nr:hypothetical protein [Deltaproteobacteria bacterium]